MSNILYIQHKYSPYILQDDDEEEKGAFIMKLINAARSGAQQKFYKHLNKALNKWQNVPLKVAVIGATGSGKSSFINKIRGIKSHRDPLAAEVGVTETTKAVKDYPHPNNKNLVFYDLPGCGTKAFPLEKYMEKVDFKRFDFFIIMCYKRFTETDLKIAKEINKEKKCFYFVRSHIDADVDSNYKDKDKPEEETLHDIRTDCQKHLDEDGLTNHYIFLVSNREPDKFDFNKLTMRMVNDVSDLKRSAFVLTMSNLSSEMLEKKKEHLQKRIWKVAVGSAISGIIPIPGMGRGIDILIVTMELKFYRAQFQIDETSIEEFEKENGVHVEDLLKENSIPISTSSLMHSTEQLYNFMFEDGHVYDSMPKKLVYRMLSSFVGNNVFAYSSCERNLKRLLDICVAERKVLNEHVAKKVANSVKILSSMTSSF